MQTVARIKPMREGYCVPSHKSSSPAKYLAVKEETHAARWGLLRGYSGKATKWVDFVVTNSTRRESSHLCRLERNSVGVKRE